MAFDVTNIHLGIDSKDVVSGIKLTQKAVQTGLEKMRLDAKAFSDTWGDLTSGIKDTKRIVSGILVSQAFYSISSAAITAASSVLQFSKDMQTAGVSMEYFVSGTEKFAKAQAFLREMNTFAAKTPFNTKSALELSKYMQAVGVSMNATKSVLKVITDTASATGATEENLQRVVFGLGQMLTKGRLANEEIRQLANANIPVYEILQEQLGLTGKQISNIGKNWVSADKAVVAILNGLTKRYEGAADKISNTMSGMTETIVDNSLIITQVASKGIFDKISTGMTGLRDLLNEYREIATTQGSGGLFFTILKDLDSSGEVGTMLISLIGNMRNLTQAANDLLVAAKPLLGVLGKSGYASISVFAYGLTSLANAAEGALKILDNLGITSKELGSILAELYIVYSVSKWMTFLGQSVSATGVAMIGLGRNMWQTLTAFNAVHSATRWVTGGITAAIVAIGALGGAFGMLNNIMAGLDSTKSGDNIFPDDVSKAYDEYTAKMEAYNAQIAQYQESFNQPYTSITEGADSATDALEDVTDASTKAAKKVKDSWTASFDEVFTIPESVQDAAKKTTDFGDFLKLPTYNFPKIEIPEDKLEMPKLDWNAIYGGNGIDTNIMTDDFWKNLLLQGLPMALLGVLNTMGKAGGKLADDATGKALIKGLANLTDLHRVTDADLVKYTDELLESIKYLNEDILGLKAAAGYINDPAVLKKLGITEVNEDLVNTIARKLELDDAYTRKLLKKINEIRVVKGMQPLGFTTLDETGKVTDITAINRVQKQLDEVQKAITDHSPDADIVTLLNDRKRLLKELQSLTVKTVDQTSSEFFAEYKNLIKLSAEGNGVSKYADSKLLISLRDTANKIIASGKILADAFNDPTWQKDIYTLSKTISDISDKLYKDVKRSEVLTDTIATLRKNAVANASELNVLGNEYNTLSTNIQGLRAELEAYRTALVQTSPEQVDQARIKEEAILAKKEEDARVAAIAAGEREAKRLKELSDNVLRQQRVADRVQTDALYEQTDKINDNLKEINETLKNTRTVQVTRIDEIKAKIAELEGLYNGLEDEKLAEILTKEFKILTSADNKNNVEVVYNRVIKGLEEELAGLEKLTAPIKNLDDITVKYNSLKQALAEDIGKTTKAFASISAGELNELILRQLSEQGMSAMKFLASGTKLNKLNMGLGGYGGSIPEMLSGIFDEFASFADPTSNFLKNVSSLGLEIEDILIDVTKAKVANLGVLLGGTTIADKDKLLVTQLDSILKQLDSSEIPMDIKTVSGRMFDMLFKDGNIDMSVLTRYKPEWYTQFAAQAYNMNTTRAGVSVFNRDYDFGDAMGERWNAITHTGKQNKIFSTEAINSYLTAFDKPAGEEGIKSYFQNVIMPLFTTKSYSDALKTTIEKVDFSPLSNAIKVDVIDYSASRIKELVDVDNLKAWQKYEALIASVKDSKHVQDFIKTYIEFDTSLGKTTVGVNLAGTPRTYTKMSANANRWLQSVMGYQGIKFNQFSSGPTDEFEELIDRLVEDINRTGDEAKFTEQMQSIIKDVENRSKGFKAEGKYKDIIDQIKGDYDDYQNLLKALEKIEGSSTIVLKQGRVLRSVIEQVNGLNNKILDGMSVTYDELFGISRSFSQVGQMFKIQDTKAFNDVVVALNNMMITAKEATQQGIKGATFDTAQQINLPFKSVGIKETLDYTAGELLDALDKGIISGDEMEKAVRNAISDMSPKFAADTVANAIDDASKYIGKQIILDIEATGLKTGPATDLMSISQIAARNITTGQELITYINRGHDINLDILRKMQNIANPNNPLSKRVADINKNVEEQLKNGRSIDGIVSDMAKRNALRPDELTGQWITKVEELLTQNISSDDILKRVQEFSELSDVSKQWLDVKVEMLDAGISLEEATKQLRAMGIETSQIIGHNVRAYDTEILRQVTDLDLSVETMYDTLTKAKDIFGLSGNSLSSLYTRFTGELVTGAHNAETDIKMTQTIWEGLQNGLAANIRDTAYRLVGETKNITNADFDIAAQAMREFGDDLGIIVSNLRTILPNTKLTLDELRKAAALDFNTPITDLKAAVDSWTDLNTAVKNFLATAGKASATQYEINALANGVKLGTVNDAISALTKSATDLANAAANLNSSATGKGNVDAGGVNADGTPSSDVVIKSPFDKTAADAVTEAGATATPKPVKIDSTAKAPTGWFRKIVDPFGFDESLDNSWKQIRALENSGISGLDELINGLKAGLKSSDTLLKGFVKEIITGYNLVDVAMWGVTAGNVAFSNAGLQDAYKEQNGSDAALSEAILGTMFKQVGQDMGADALGWIAAGIAAAFTGGGSILAPLVAELVTSVGISVINDVLGRNTMSWQAGPEIFKQTEAGTISENEQDFWFNQLVSEFENNPTNTSVVDRLNDLFKDMNDSSTNENNTKNYSQIFGTAAGRELAKLWLSQATGNTGMLSEEELLALTADSAGTSSELARISEYLAKIDNYEKQIADTEQKLAEDPWNSVSLEQALVGLKAGLVELKENTLVFGNNPDIQSQGEWLEALDKRNAAYYDWMQFAKYYTLTLEDVAQSTNSQGAVDLVGISNLFSEGLMGQINDMIEKQMPYLNMPENVEDLTPETAAAYKSFFGTLVTDVSKSISDALRLEGAYTSTSQAPIGTDEYSRVIYGMFKDLTSEDFSSYSESLKELGISFVKVSDQMAQINIDPTEIKDNITGWTMRLPENLNLGEISVSDVNILASAGIQINANGTVTFSQPVNPEAVGTSREVDLTKGAMSQSLVDTLKTLGIGFNFNKDGTIAGIDTSTLADSMTSALVRMSKDVSGIWDEPTTTALAGLGRKTDSGFFEIQNAAVLKGQKSIADYFAAIGDEAKKIPDDIKAVLLQIDTQLGLGKGATDTDIAERADGITVASTIDGTKLSEDVSAALAAAGITFATEGDKARVIVSTLSDDINATMSRIPAYMYDQLSPDVKTALGALFGNLKEDAGFYLLDFQKVFEGNASDIVEIYVNKPELWDKIPAAFRQYLEQSAFETTNGITKINIAALEGMTNFGTNWFQSWSEIPSEVVKQMDATKLATVGGFLKIEQVTEETKIPEDVNTYVLKPFSDLPLEIQQRMTGPDGVTDKLKGSQILITNATGTAMMGVAETVRTALSGATVAAAEGGTDIGAAIGASITTAFTNALNVQALQQTVGTTWDWIRGNISNILSPAGAKADVQGKQWIPEYDTKGNLITWHSFDANGKPITSKNPVFEAPKVPKQKTTPKGPGFAYGGIITSDGWYRAGEYGNEEGIIPLQNKVSLGVIGQAIAEYIPSSTVSGLMAARYMQDAGVSLPRNRMYQEDNTAAVTKRILESVLPAMSNTSVSDPRPVVYVENFIGDERGLKDLERRLNIIRLKNQVGSKRS